MHASHLLQLLLNMIQLDASAESIEQHIDENARRLPLVRMLCHVASADALNEVYCTAFGLEGFCLDALMRRQASFTASSLPPAQVRSVACGVPDSHIAAGVDVPTVLHAGASLGHVPATQYLQ